MIRVLHLVKTSTGARWAALQVRQLVKLGVEVHVAAPPGGARIAEYKAAGATVYEEQFDLPVKEPWRLHRVLGRLRRLVREVKPDLIHSHFVGTTLTMRLALGKRHPIPRLFHVPGPLHLENALFRKLDLRTAGPADYWIGSCQWTCQAYRTHGVPHERVFLAYYGTDLSKYQDVEPGQLRAELGLSREIPLVGMVALMYKPKLLLGQRRGLKGHEDFIDALALCLKERPDLRGVCVRGGALGGAKSYEQYLRRYGEARCGNRLVFTGTKPNEEIPGIYCDLDVAVVPSHTENCGGAFESMIMGVPTIATDVGGLPDLVRPGETGWLVPPRSPQHLAEAILNVLEDPQQMAERGRKGQERALYLFDVRQTAAEVRDIYERICSTGERAGDGG